MAIMLSKAPHGVVPLVPPLGAVERLPYLGKLVPPTALLVALREMP